MKVAITCESSTDLNSELYKKYDIQTVEVPVTMGDISTVDTKVTAEEIYNLYDTKKILAKSSGPNIFSYQQLFKNVFDQGYDYIIHIAMSSNMSCSYNNAVTASKSFSNVSVIDARTCSTGVGILTIHTRKLLDSGMSVEKVVERISKMAYHIESSFIIEKSNYLYYAGRCSYLKKVVANLLRLRPEVHIVTKLGHLVLGKLFNGNLSKCILKYVDFILEKFNTPDKSLAFVTYTTMPKEIVDKVVNKVKNAGFNEVIVTTTGAALSLNAGPHSLGLVYKNDNGIEY